MKVLMIILLAGACSAAFGQKATPSPTPKLFGDWEKGIQELGQDLQFQKTLKDLIKHADTGFKAIKGDKRGTSGKHLLDTADDYSRYASKIQLDGAAAQEILETTLSDGSKGTTFVAYFSEKDGLFKTYNELEKRVKAALGDGYTSNTTFVAEDIDDEREGKEINFWAQGKKNALLKVQLVDLVSKFDLHTSRVRLVVYGVPQK